MIGIERGMPYHKNSGFLGGGVNSSKKGGNLTVLPFLYIINSVKLKGNINGTGENNLASSV